MRCVPFTSGFAAGVLAGCLLARRLRPHAEARRGVREIEAYLRGEAARA